MTRKSLLGTHLYSQIVVPLIAASVCLALVASVVAVYFLQDLTSKWVTQVADATTTGVVDRYMQHEAEMHDVGRALAEDFAIRDAVDSGNASALHSELASEAALVPFSGIAILDSSGRVISSAGEESATVGSVLGGARQVGSAGASSTAVQTQTDPASIVAIEPIATKHAEQLAILQRIDTSLLGQLAGAANGGFCFYSAQGAHVACTVSATLPTAARGTLASALMSGNPTIVGAIGQAGADGVGRATMALGTDKYRVVARRISSSDVAQGGVEGYIVGSVSQGVSDDATKTSMNLIFVWSTIAVIALVALGFWVARRVSDPLLELAEGARRIADGDFTTKVHVPGGNELAVLGDTFNDMTDSLRERSESLTKKVLELATLYEMSRALGSTLDMDDLLGSTLDSALRIFDLDVGYVALRDRDTGTLEIRAVRGGSASEPEGTQAVRSSMAEWVVREGRPLIFNPDASSAGGQIDTLTGAKAALCVPLVSAEGTIGAITVGSSDEEYRFNSDDVRLLSTIGNHVTIAIGNIELFTSLQEAYLATVRSLAAAVDAKDTYTRGHSDKVSTYATLIAQRMGLSHDQLTALEMAAYLHDIGKIGVPEGILLKPGRLTDDEMTQMRHHPLIGANILKPVAFPWAITPIVRHHHEYWDGNGYPAGLKGEEIPLLARILCVADSYEAMTADRPYRAGRSAEEAVEELHHCSGTQFDPRVVEMMTAVVEDLERGGGGVLRDLGEDISAEEARAIFAALVDGVLASFRRLGGPRLASNVEAEVGEYFLAQRVPFRMVRGRLTFADEPGDNVAAELDQMRGTLHHIDAVIGRVSGGTLVDHFYDDALETFSARMRQLAVALEFHTEDQ
jgi:putative nucleotidyltransferase with HDIG domain